MVAIGSGKQFSKGIKLAVLFCTTMFIYSAKCCANEVFILVQDSAVAGPQNVYVAAKSVRVDNQRTGTTIVCRAPKWDVYLYNKRNRLTYHCTADEFRASFFQENTKPYRENLRDLPWKREIEEARDGVTMAKYAVHLDTKSARVNILTVPVREADYWLATSLKLPAKVCNVIARLGSLPQLDLLPVDCVYREQNGNTTHALAIKSIKKISVVDPFFEVPKFTVAASERDVFIDPTAHDAIEGMFGEDKSK